MLTWAFDSFRMHRIRRILETSGEPTHRTPGELLFMAWLLGLGALTLAGFVFFLPVPNLPEYPFLDPVLQAFRRVRESAFFQPPLLLLEALILFWMAHRLPITVFLLKRREMLRKLDSEIIHVFTIVASCLEFGLSFEHSLREVLKIHKGLLRDPILGGLAQINAGADPGLVWPEVIRQVNNSDFTRLLQSILTLKSQGITANNAIVIQIDMLQAKRKQRFGRHAARLQVWSRFVLVLCFLPALAATIVGAISPLGFQLFLPYGWSLLCLFLFWQYAGIGIQASPPE